MQQDEKYVISTEWDGRPRRLYARVCLQCGIEFYARMYWKGGKGLFCNRQCAAKHKHEHSKVDVTCAVCGKQFSKRPSQLKNATKGKHFCSRRCKDFGQSVEGGIKEIQPSHYRDGMHCYRVTNRSRLAGGCVDCGEKRLWMLHIHHIDGERRHNKKSNLEIVCSNDHLKRHLRWDGEEWIRDNRALTPRDKLPFL